VYAGTSGKLGVPSKTQYSLNIADKKFDSVPIVTCTQYKPAAGMALLIVPPLDWMELVMSETFAVVSAISLNRPFKNGTFSGS
jgi:hypothetical protein